MIRTLVPHAWPDVRITRAETLPSPSLLAGRVNLLKCMESPCDVACPEEAASDGGVKDVDCGLVDNVFGSVVSAKGCEWSHWQENNLVGGGWQQCVGERGCNGDVAYPEVGTEWRHPGMLSVLVLTMKVSIVATRHMCILHARSMGH